jgi:hypothetical protein
VLERPGMTPTPVYGERVAESETVDPEKLAVPFRSAAYLTILSDALSPTELAQMVGLRPDESWEKGDRQSHQVRRTRPHNGITYESRLPESSPYGEHLAALLTRLAPYATEIASTAAQGSVLDVTLWVVEHTESDMTDIILGPEEIRVASAMGASVVASSYFSPEYDDQ